MKMEAARQRHIPNIITFVRIPLTLILIHFILQDEYVSAALVIAVICLTDISDGAAARALGACTHLGAYMDVAADLLYVMASLIVLNIKDLAPSWFTMVTALKFVDFAITSSILKRDAGNKCTWVFDDLGRCFSALTFISPGIFCLAALFPGNMRYVVYYILIPASALAVISFVCRIARCVRITKKLPDRPFVERRINNENR